MLYTFPDPRAAVSAALNAGKPTYWPTATISTSYPDADKDEAVTAPHIQHAWDGTPSEQSNREFCTIRVTVWTPEGQIAAGIALASLVRAYLLESGSSTVWRYTPGAGRLPGKDDATKLQFCTFTVTAETRPSAVA